VIKDLRQLDKKVTVRIIQQLEEGPGEDPNIGGPLSGQFKGLFKYRVGDHRIIYAKTRDGVLVLRVGHRSKLYR
jgi:mRNA interferase RelE/StbE